MAEVRLELNSVEELDLLDELPTCGCGRPELVLDLLHRFLQATPPAGGTGDFPADPVDLAGGNETLYYLAVYTLDHMEATEHGGNVSGAWRTEKGERLLAILDRYAEVGWDATPCVPVDTPS